MHYYRTRSQIDILLREYKEEIRSVERMLETEEDLRTRAIHQETLAENMEALKNLEEFLEENPNIFK